MEYGGTWTDEEEEYPKEPSWLGYLHFTLGVLVGCKWFLYNYCISLTEKDGQGVWCNVLPHEPPPAIPVPIPSSANSIQDGNLMAPATPPPAQVEEAGNSTVAPVTTAPGAAAAVTPAATSTTTTQEEKSTAAAAAAPSANPPATKETVAPKKKGDALLG